MNRPAPGRGDGVVFCPPNDVCRPFALKALAGMISISESLLSDSWKVPGIVTRAERSGSVLMTGTDEPIPGSPWKLGTVENPARTYWISLAVCLRNTRMEGVQTICQRPTGQMERIATWEKLLEETKPPENSSWSRRASSASSRSRLALSSASLCR